MDDPAFQKKINRGVAWISLSAALVAVFEMVGLVVILRYWVSTKEFGLASTVVTLFAALELVGEMGLVSAAIQRQDVDEDRRSTMFWVGILLAVCLYGLIFFGAPLFAGLHGQPRLTALARVGALMLLIRSTFTMHLAVLKQQLRFREIAVVRIIANVAELGVKVGTAAGGAGPWCFIWGVQARTAVYAIGIIACVRWRPRLVCRPRMIKDDIRFGLRSTGAELLYQLYANMDYQIVTGFFGPAALGVYRAAKDLVLEPVRFVSGVITTVAFPTFARLRFDSAAVVEQFIKFTRQNLVVVLTMLATILVTADDALAVVLGGRYVEAATAARILAIVGALRSLSHLGPPLLDGLGRPDLTLRYQVTAAVVLTTLFTVFAAVGREYGFVSVAVAWAVGYPIAFTVLSWLIFDRLGLTARAYAGRIWRIVALVAVGGVIGAVVRASLGEVDVAVRFGFTATTVIVFSLGLLGMFDQISLRGIIRSLRT